MFSRNRPMRPLAASLLLLSIFAPAAPALGRDLGRDVDAPDAHAAVTLHAGLATGGDLDDPNGTSLQTLWRRSADLDARLDAVAGLQARLAPPAPSLARARLALNPADLQGHRVLAASGDAAHGAAVRAVAERLRATGDGSEARPWRVPSAGDAVALLRLLGETPVGGYYAAPGPWRLTLLVYARPDGAPWAQPRHFDLSETLAAWHDAGAFSGAAVDRRHARDLIAAWAEQSDHFALTTTGLLTASERGEAGHYRAGRDLLRAADAGNGVARFSLGDLYLQLAEREGQVAGQALASARAHHALAADLGLGHAHFKLGVLADRAGDASAALRHLEAAHAAGQEAALMALAKLVHREDPSRAQILLRDAARAGNGDAAYELAVLNLAAPATGDPDPDAVPDELTLALLMRAAEAGHTNARLFLGDLAATGEHLEQDLDRARELWSAVAAESEDVDAVLAAAKALTRNRARALRDPHTAARALQRILTTERVAATCVDCWRVLAAALEARGDTSAARDVIATGRRTLADASALASAPGR